MLHRLPDPVLIIDSNVGHQRSVRSDVDEHQGHFPKPQVLDLSSGMHRFVWDLAWGTTAKPEGHGGDDDEEYGAPRGPRVIPGTYQLKLTVDGASFAQPLTVVMDPRSVATPAELEQQEKLGRQMFAETTRSRQVLGGIHQVQKQLTAVREKLGGQQTPLSERIEQVQDAIKKIVNGTGGSGGNLGLQSASGGLASALRVVESGNRAVPEQAVAVFEESDRAAKLRIDEWNNLEVTLLVQLNDELKQANEIPIPIGGVELEMDE